MFSLVYFRCDCFIASFTKSNVSPKVLLLALLVGLFPLVVMLLIFIGMPKGVVEAEAVGCPWLLFINENPEVLELELDLDRDLDRGGVSRPKPIKSDI